MSDTALISGETSAVTIVFSEAVAGFDSTADITVPNGTLSSMSSSDNITWTGTYTPTANVEDATNVLTLATSYTDTAGNAGPLATTANFTIDTTAPTVSSFTMSDTALISGETSTVTIVFSEAVAGFDSTADITVPNGTLSSMSSSDNITWTGTYTPTANVEDATNVLTLATSYTDTAGNAGPLATTANFTIDTTTLVIDTDGDGIPDVTDTDDDGDGFSDADEAACGTDPLDATDAPTDTDADGIPDCIDTDDDGDGTLDTDDDFPLDASEDTDTDGDGTGNNADTDDDGDGMSDDDEIACGSDPLDATDTATDTDRDNIPDCADTDDDNDGTLDVNDDFPLDASEDTDTDGDGIGNNADTDDDDDGLSDDA